MPLGIDDYLIISGLVTIAGSILNAFTAKRVDPPRSAQDIFYEKMVDRFEKVGKIRRANAQLASLASGQPIENFQLGGSQYGKGEDIISKYEESGYSENIKPEITPPKTRGGIYQPERRGTPTEPVTEPVATEETGISGTTAAPQRRGTRPSPLRGREETNLVDIGFDPGIIQKEWNEKMNQYDLLVQHPYGKGAPRTFTMSFDKWINTNLGRSWYDSEENRKRILNMRYYPGE